MHRRIVQINEKYEQLDERYTNVVHSQKSLLDFLQSVAMMRTHQFDVYSDDTYEDQDADQDVDICNVLTENKENNLCIVDNVLNEPVDHFQELDAFLDGICDEDQKLSPSIQDHDSVEKGKIEDDHLEMVASQTDGTIMAGNGGYSRSALMRKTIAKLHDVVQTHRPALLAYFTADGKSIVNGFKKETVINSLLESQL